MHLTKEIDFHHNDKQGSHPAEEAVNGEIRVEEVRGFRKAFEQNPVLSLAQLVLDKDLPLSSIRSREAIINTPFVFNMPLQGIDGKGSLLPPSDQGSSGRCWLFATMNVLRYDIAKRLNLDKFELSQSYSSFYDKLEKANFYMETIIQVKNEPLDSRLMTFLNSDPTNDGGQWQTSVNVLEKYGMLPQALFPDTFSACHKRGHADLLDYKAREYCLALRASDEPRKLKEGFMKEVFNILAIDLGTPPGPEEEVVWEYEDKDGKAQKWCGTPLDSYRQFVKHDKLVDPINGVCIVNDPRNEYDKLYTIRLMGNVWGASGVKYVNAPMSALERATIACIKHDIPVWIGCNHRKSTERPLGIMSQDIHPVELAYNVKLGMSKKERMLTREENTTHSMVIVAIHVEDGRTVRYKIENSKSKEDGNGGYFVATAEWFNEHVQQVVIPRSLAEQKWVNVLDQGDAIELDTWDPMY